jgi:hypothetical protein
MLHWAARKASRTADAVPPPRKEVDFLVGQLVRERAPRFDFSRQSPKIIPKQMRSAEFRFRPARAPSSQDDLYLCCRQKSKKCQVTKINGNSLEMPQLYVDFTLLSVSLLYHHFEAMQQFDSYLEPNSFSCFLFIEAVGYTSKLISKMIQLILLL